ncbi:MAG: aminotransferase class IV [Candidatus Marinimicrobia bacterium]|nr:aminotransferase class IV [Candidatus Neomarinimicrobiota bacterium]
MHNSKFINESDARLPLLSDAVMYGAGLFETFRSRSGKRLLFKEKHVDRLMRSILETGLKFGIERNQILLDLDTILQMGPEQEQVIKIYACDGQCFITSKNWTPQLKKNEAVNLLIVSGGRTNAQWKSSSYFDSLIAWRDAQNQGYYDALFIDQQGYVLENSRSNFFWAKEGIVYTEKNNVLPGITRDFIMNQKDVPTQWGKITYSEVESCDELFLSNAVAGIVPVKSVTHKLKKIIIKSGPITKYLSDLLGY